MKKDQNTGNNLGKGQTNENSDNSNAPASQRAEGHIPGQPQGQNWNNLTDENKQHTAERVEELKNAGQQIKD